MDSPGTWEILRSTIVVADGAGLRNGARPMRSVSAAWERTRGRTVGRMSETISESVFGAGSLSALIVLMTPGNAARVDPVEGSEAPCCRTAFGKHSEVL